MHLRAAPAAWDKSPVIGVPRHSPLHLSNDRWPNRSTSICARESGAAGDSSSPRLFPDRLQVLFLVSRSQESQVGGYAGK